MISTDRKLRPAIDGRQWSFDDYPEARNLLAPHAADWIASALSTRQYDEAERGRICESLRGLYAAGGLASPKVVIFTPSTRQLTIGGPIATGVRWLLADESRQVTHCGTQLTQDQIREAVDLAIRACLVPGSVSFSRLTVNATDNATDNATYNATVNATYNATVNATYNATRNATYNATRNATYNATDNATRNATYNATYNATRNATYNATYNATDNATYNATDNATRNATYNATDNATRNATVNATRNATDNATYNATVNATYNATRNATVNATERAAQFLVLCTRHWLTEYNGGCEWSAWPCYLAFGRIAGRTDVDYSKWIHYEQLARCGPRYMHPEFAMVSERPVVLDVDSSGQLVPGASKRYRDGSAIADGQWVYGEGDSRILTYILHDGRYLPYILHDGRYLPQFSGVPDDACATLWAETAKRAPSVELLVEAESQMLAWGAGT